MIEGTGYQTTKQIMQAIFNLHQKLWLARNHALHGESSLELRNIREQEFAEI
jgi:hypothetical protein